MAPLLRVYIPKKISARSTKRPARVLPTQHLCGDKLEAMRSRLQVPTRERGGKGEDSCPGVMQLRAASEEKHPQHDGALGMALSDTKNQVCKSTGMQAGKTGQPGLHLGVQAERCH